MKKFLLAAGCVAMMASAVSAKDYVISKVDMTMFTESTYTYDNKEKKQIAGTWSAEDGTVFNVVMKQQAKKHRTHKHCRSERPVPLVQRL